MKRKMNKRAVALLVSLVLVLAIAAGTTLALILTQTNDIENIFQPSRVSCAVVENDQDYQSGTLSVGSKGEVKIKNTGNTNAYIRAKIIVTWKNEDGKVWAEAPVKGTDYTIIYVSSWKVKDGYLYYPEPLEPGKATDNLIESANLEKDATAPVGTDGSQYYLSVEIVASAIQASPTDVVEDQWKVEVGEGGRIVAEEVKE